VVFWYLSLKLSMPFFNFFVKLELYHIKFCGRWYTEIIMNIIHEIIFLLTLIHIVFFISVGISITALLVLSLI
jgi:hypothetical protein